MNNRSSVFQGLRFIMILGIVGIHLGQRIFGNIEICSFFFILSGFFYTTPKNLKNYIIKKITRIFIPYWIVFFLAIIFFRWPICKGMIPYFLLLQSFRIYGYFNYVGVSWFLSSLLFCYLLAPVIEKKLKNITSYFSFFILVITTVVIANLPYPTDWGIWPYYINPFFCFIEYAIGMQLSLLIKNQEPISIRYSSQLGIIFLIIYLTILHFEILGKVGFLIHIVATYYFYMFPSNAVNKCLGNFVFIKISKYILYIYLIHFLVILYINEPKNWYLGLFSILIGIAFGIVYENTKKILTINGKRIKY